MARRRRRLRRPRGTTEFVAASTVALAVLVLLVRAAEAGTRAAMAHWPVLAALVGAAGVAAAVWWARRRTATRARLQRLATLRLSLPGIDALGDQEFEYALRDLLVRDGWSARKVGRQGDQAADVIGRHPALGRIVLQAKHTTVGAKVGSQVMYQVKGTAGPVHGADVAVVVTNGSFTRDAKVWGDKHGVHWIDRDRLGRWAEHGTALHDLLRLPAGPPRRRALGAPAATRRIQREGAHGSAR
ncbi:restriction endonuclease [Streptomyces sp. SP17BM10]|uniref:restriction endonuclease n=1 Tax=Streptomyces sp. SP17BM10 TaxID=3002530 RepID=UPI002E779489|nr:restriction endonuclease [Streptomyces sp. SP17BM10]MEE1783384.1 restriction endonuclease [Streptomyces sp. SP17BM10]